MDSLKADSSVQSAVWNITDDRYVWGESKTFVEKVNAYSDPEIPDEGYMLTLENGDTITFYFKVFEPQKSGQQSFFSYKIVTNEVPEHKHNHDELKSNDKFHWYECDCGDKKDVEPEDKPDIDVEPEDKPSADDNNADEEIIFPETGSKTNPLFIVAVIFGLVVTTVRKKNKNEIN